MLFYLLIAETKQLFTFIKDKLSLPPYHEQVHGAAIGSPISPLIANLFMEEFEVKALNSAPTPQCLWLRYVDICVIQEAEHHHQLLQHTNTQDPHIQFIVEELEQEELYHSCTPWFLQVLTTPSLLQCTKGHTHRSISTLGQQPLHHSNT